MAQTSTISKIEFFLPEERRWANDFEMNHPNWHKEEDQVSIVFTCEERMEVTEDEK